MRGPEKYPDTGDIVSAMNKLQGKLLSEKELVKILPLCRFDIRLAETFILFLSQNWKLLNGFALNDALRSQLWSNALGVLLEQVGTLLIPKDELQNFTRWKRLVLFQIKPANSEFFWIGLDVFAGKRMKRSVENSIKAYTTWGYLGDELLINKSYFKKSFKTQLSSRMRMALLKQLAQTKSHFYLHDYLEVLEGKVQRRVAELDLQKANFLRKIGNTKSRYYKLKSRGSHRMD